MVWVVIGIISVILGVGIIVNMLFLGEQSISTANVDSALDRLANQCNQVCRLPVETASSTSVQLPKDVLLYTQEDLLCATQNEESSCRRCNCDFGEYTEQLDLTNSPLNNHEYSCRFTKESQTIISMECQG